MHCDSIALCSFFGVRSLKESFAIRQCSLEGSLIANARCGLIVCRTISGGAIRGIAHCVQYMQQANNGARAETATHPQRGDARIWSRTRTISLSLFNSHGARADLHLTPTFILTAWTSIVRYDLQFHSAAGESAPSEKWRRKTHTASVCVCMRKKRNCRPKTMRIKLRAYYSCSREFHPMDI